MIRSRTFATEEAKTEQPAVELTESEKKLTEEVDKLGKDVETLSEKNREIDVS
jgi:peptidoglycan hydrolase CwlO-like protein